MTREECEKALTQMGEAYYNSDTCFSALEGFSKNVELFYKLIHEHFYNPPLKFQELKEGMWIWDNNWNQYFEICEIYPKTKEFDVLIHQNRINRLRYEPMKFEENRFYRKQVEE